MEDLEEIEDPSPYVNIDDISNINTENPKLNEFTKAMIEGNGAIK